jgi:hypothetical protein
VLTPERDGAAAYETGAAPYENAKKTGFDAKKASRKS